MSKSTPSNNEPKSFAQVAIENAADKLALRNRELFAGTVTSVGGSLGKAVEIQPRKTIKLKRLRLIKSIYISRIETHITDDSCKFFGYR